MSVWNLLVIVSGIAITGVVLSIFALVLFFKGYKNHTKEIEELKMYIKKEA